MTVRGRNNPKAVPCWLGAVSGIMLSLFLQQTAFAQEKFASPEAAADKLVAAVRAGNQADVLKVLGPDGKDILSSGDKVADNDVKALFLTGYDLRHEVARKDSNTAELIVGADEWPLPIPIVKEGGKWSFDTSAGKREILYRRIGANELRAVQAALAYVDAQNDYIEMNPEGSDPPVYARKFISTEGKKDGLYWPAAANEKQSPLGAAFALATAAGYRLTGEQAPFHGYYYKILTAQGPKAPGGAANYIVNDKMIGGFALVAYPATYGNSGVMAFVVSNDGVIYQKDLGKKTASIASDMTTFNPDQTWKKVSDSDLVAVH